MVPQRPSPVSFALAFVFGTSLASAHPGAPHPPAVLSSQPLGGSGGPAGSGEEVPACPIVLSGSSDAAWASAVRALERRDVWRGADCQRIEVLVVRGAATLTYVTSDGRSAVRSLSGPSELEPTVVALGVTTPDAERVGDTDERSRALEMSRTSRGEASEEPRPPKPTLRLTPEQEPASSFGDTGAEVTPSSLPNDSKVLFGFGMGMRSGTRLLSPLLTGTAALALEDWELAVQGRYEAHYMYVDDEHRDGSDPEEERPGTAGLGAGVMVGRRQPLGNTLLIGGALVNVTSLHDGTDDEPDEGAADAEETRVNDQSRGRAEARVGAYAGFVFPRRSYVRFRSELAAEVVPHSIGASETRSDGIPMMPWWAVCFTLGMEFGKP